MVMVMVMVMVMMMMMRDSNRVSEVKCEYLVERCVKHPE